MKAVEGVVLTAALAVTCRQMQSRTAVTKQSLRLASEHGGSACQMPPGILLYSNAADDVLCEY
jgi:hypothetical protein